MSQQQGLPFDPIAEARRHWEEHGWADAASGMAAVTSVMRAHQLMLARVESVLRPHSLTFSRYEVLTLLTFTQRGELPMSKASTRLQVHPTSITNAVDRLEAAGLVERIPHPDDRRTTLVRITDTGRDVAERATKDLNEYVFADPGISEEHIAQLVAVLAEFRVNAGDFHLPE
ncbi:MarR family winged helix-turn-helix transcriptional regulator [Hoyosella subflava]|uniref:Putative MarR family transcriptional regulator n=1 Tax=Hoyosella subflava (strain DSM 45089 / JCM 17490 / NBRC 109087 / DQS3-9A1) TaxID=443218 RepID=F6EHD0_HOYSD|nr:MarR family transcriptional regulator [Hoyosella subflava]AEF41109.1 Putative MarR family transcriptional regulator [Hoyosella subflava DQS3-9A1]